MFHVSSSRRIFKRVHKIAESDCSLLHVCPPIRLSACNNSAPIGRIFMKFGICEFFENLSWKSNFCQNQTRLMGTLYENQNTFFIISHSIRIRMRNFSNTVVQKIKTHFMLIFFIFIVTPCMLSSYSIITPTTAHI